MNRYSTVLLAGVVAGLCAGAPGGASAEIGILAAVNQDMTGERPTEAPRQIFIREQLIQNERIETTGGGGGQVLFLDQTSLTIAPNSSIVLDKYVYDPESQTGEIGVSVIRGTLRFVGGRITKTSEATITTPTATIGIRGGISNTVVGGDGGTTHFHLAGISSRISSNGQVLTITREGGYAQIPVGGPPDYLGVATTAAIVAAIGVGAGTGSGGSQTAGGAAGSSSGIGAVSEVGSGADGAVNDAPFSTSGERQSVEFAASDIGPVDPPTEDLSDQTISEVVDDMANDPTQFMDGVVFLGDHTVSVQTLEGPINATTSFQMLYSIQSAQGTVLYGLPDTGDIFTSNGADAGADGFVVIGQGGSIVNEPNLATLFQGNPDGTFQISGGNLSGSYSVDYRGSTFAVNIRQVDGTVNNIPGIDAPGADLDATTQAFRDVISQGSGL